MIRRGLLLVLLCGLSAGATQAADLKQKQKALEDIRSRIETLSQSLDKDQSRSDRLSRDLQRSERRIAGLEGEVARLREQTAAQQQRIKDTEAERSQAQQGLERGLRNLRQQLRAAYIVGRQGRTQALLNQDDANRVGRVLVYYDYLQRAQLQALAGIRSRLNELETLAERLQAEVVRLDELRAEQEKALEGLKRSRAERSDMLKELKERIADEKGELKRLQADEASVQDLIKRLQKALSDLPPDAAFSDKPFTTLKGKLPWPVRGTLIAHYGEAKAGGKLSWKGHWIAAAEGSAVKAVARGRVVYVGWLHRYGLIVLLEHEGGYYSLYGHTQSTSASVGDNVRAGQVIAAAGSTGGHERSGLYFELRKGTTAIDPRLWLAR